MLFNCFYVDSVIPGPVDIDFQMKNYHKIMFKFSFFFFTIALCNAAVKIDIKIMFVTQVIYEVNHQLPAIEINICPILLDS